MVERHMVGVIVERDDEDGSWVRYDDYKALEDKLSSSTKAVLAQQAIIEEQQFRLDEVQKSYQRSVEVAMAATKESADNEARFIAERDESLRRLDTAETLLKGMRAELEMARGCTDLEAHEHLRHLRERVVEKACEHPKTIDTLTYGKLCLECGEVVEARPGMGELIAAAYRRDPEAMKKATDELLASSGVERGSPFSESMKALEAMGEPLKKAERELLAASESIESLFKKGS